MLARPVKAAHNHPPCTWNRLIARLRFYARQPASDAVMRVLELEGTHAVGWLLAGAHFVNGKPVESGSPVIDKTCGITPVLDELRRNAEVDEKGLATLLRALELVRSAVPDFEADHGPRVAFLPTIADEIGAVKEFMSALDGIGEDCAHPLPEYVAPLHLELKDLFEPWAPPEALQRWGFIVAAFCTPTHKEVADRLRRSLRAFGLPYTFQEVSTVHPTLSPKAAGGPETTKPNFIYAMLERHQLPVLYMDCDLIVLDEPVHVQEALRVGSDWGICNFLAAEVCAVVQPIGALNSRELYRLTLGGPDVRIRTSEQALSNAAISIWNNTEGARTVLRRWHQELVFYANACSFQSTGDPARGVGVWTVADDQVLDWMWNNRARLYRGELLNVKVYWLPMSYARLPLFPFVPPIVNHPDYISDGPRMPVPAHRGTRKVHVAYSTPLKTKQAAIASGVPGPLYALDMATGMACRQPQDLSSEINFDLDIKVQLYPPGMVEWGELGGPPSRTAHRGDPIMDRDSCFKSPIVLEEHKLMLFCVPKNACSALKRLAVRMMGKEWRDFKENAQ